MRIVYFFAQLLLVACLNSCTVQAQSPAVQRIVVNENDATSGYYLSIEPKGKIEGVLVLLSGFSQQAESIFPETKLDSVAYHNNILTIGFAAGYMAYADSAVQARLTTVLKDVVKRYKMSPDKFAMGGFSAGGTIVLRYTELCYQYPGRFPIKPKAVFMVDSPIDVFTLWDMLDEVRETNFSQPAVQEANEAMGRMERQVGIPKDNVERYKAVNPFSMNKNYGDNEKYLKDVAVRAYHEIDVTWRLVNRRQTVRHGNYFVTSELINRLLLMGNNKAEFIQSKKTGYRANGMRHPHSWSIVDEEECIKWIKGEIKEK